MQYRKHGMYKTKLYVAWSSMKARCLNPNTPYYYLYGGRGIGIADEWMTFEPFRDWALSSGFKDGLSLERVDVNDNYCPANCTWITMAEQAANRRNVKRFNGRPAYQVARENGIHGSRLARRLRDGWSLERAVTEPMRDH